jgi:CheY-like chemotaxis protein
MEPRTPTPSAVNHPTAVRLLVVDDNADAAELLSEALELLGYETHRASDGPSALTVAEKVRPRVALLDIGLPVMDGYELAGRLRALDGLTDLKLVAVTGYGQAADRARSEAAGFDAHLVKPISLEAVRKTIEALTSG